MTSSDTIKNMAAPLLKWFDQNKRVLPFRTFSTPYRVWVSEIMLQQTRVSAALPYFERFMEELPTVADLAACPPDRLNKLWEGLGYYSRVRNLQKAACMVMDEHGGVLPANYESLKKLPGVGEYTAGAIASISFGLPEVAVDGNVLRVFARLLNDNGNVLHPETKKAMSACVRAAQPPNRPGAYNEALMELGALVCIPNGAPLCGECPLADLCAARALGIQDTLPVKTPLKARKLLPYTVLAVLCSGRVLLTQRPDTGLLAELWMPVLCEGVLSREQAAQKTAALCGCDAAQVAVEPLPDAKHVFTHLEWHMTGFACHVPQSVDTTKTDAAIIPSEGVVPDTAAAVWADAQQVQGVYAMPGAMKVYKKEILRRL